MSQTIAVVGLGYVGLPLVVEFGKHVKTIGYDIDKKKVELCKTHVDPSRELSKERMMEAVHAEYTSEPDALMLADVIIIAVPTPVDAAHKPDFGPLIGASQTVGEYMKLGAVVIYESTVYPGATEEVCIPVLQAYSHWKWKEHFFVGYSPERINPGDKEHSLTNVIKVVAGDTPETLEKVMQTYELIVEAGLHAASSIKVAEAAKVIENTQRDLNIALMNELAIIFNKIGIDTMEVLKAAGTKWNFLPFRPGLVGGHCIGVDPYYLTHKAEMIGYNPQVILAGRRINDGMGKYIAEQTIKKMIAAGMQIKGTKVNVYGLTFKENCPDIRNSKVADVIEELSTYGVEIFVHDPHADKELALHEYGVELKDWKEMPVADALIVAVAHSEYLYGHKYIKSKVRKGGVVIDVKSAYDKDEFENVNVWRL